MSDFQPRLGAAKQWTGLTDEKLIAKLAADGFNPLLAREFLMKGDCGSCTPIVAAAVAAQLGVSREWLLSGASTAVAKRLVSQLDLVDMGGRRVVEGREVVQFELSEFEGLKIRAASVPGFV